MPTCVSRYLRSMLIFAKMLSVCATAMLSVYDRVHSSCFPVLYIPRNEAYSFHTPRNMYIYFMLQLSTC